MMVEWPVTSPGSHNFAADIKTDDDGDSGRNVLCAMALSSQNLWNHELRL